VRFGEHRIGRFSLSAELGAGGLEFSPQLLDPLLGPLRPVLREAEHGFAVGQDLSNGGPAVSEQ
jgi:hypothetical protein